MLLIFAVIYSRVWIWLSKRHLNPRTPFKFVVGTALLGLGFLMFAWSGNFANSDGRVPLIFMVIGYFLFTQGELYMSPVGLSKITELSPKRFVSFFMGVWFLSSAFAFDIGGLIGKSMAITSTDPNREIEGFESLYIYTEGFADIAIIALEGALIALVFSVVIILKKWMDDVH